MKKIMILIVAVVILLAFAIGAAAQWRWSNETYLVYGDNKIRRDITLLDLSGNTDIQVDKLCELHHLTELNLKDTGLTQAQFAELSEALPECKILWSVPFQKGYLDSEDTTVSVTELSEADFAQLALLENLATVDAMGCDDYSAIMALQAERPDLDIRYSVRVGEAAYDKTTTALTVENAKAEEVERALFCLPLLEKVTLTGTTPEKNIISQWMEQYPAVTFIWNFQVCGVEASSLDTELFLNGIPMESVEEVETALKCFYNLQKVEMCGCGIPSEEMDALWKRNPQTRFIWEVQVGKATLRTDVQVFMPYLFGHAGYGKLSDQHTAELKYCVDIICMDLGHMGVSDYSFLAYMPKMQYLILADTPGKDFSVLANLKELVYLEIFITSFDQAEVLTGLTKLEDLNIGHTPLTNVAPLMEMTWLNHLWLPYTPNIKPSDRAALEEALPDTKINYYGDGCTGYGWRQLPNYFIMRDLLGMDYQIGR